MPKKCHLRRNNYSIYVNLGLFLSLIFLYFKNVSSFLQVLAFSCYVYKMSTKSGVEVRVDSDWRSRGTASYMLSSFEMLMQFSISYTRNGF